jgi:hypothetical protein
METNMNITKDAKGVGFGDRRGAALGIVVLLLLVFLGMAALSVDLGMLLAARTEAQRAADSGALSGALSLYEAPGDATRARDKAVELADLNDVRGTTNAVLTGDVDVDLSLDRVRVRVIRTPSRGTAIVNFFARILGFDASSVSAEAAAHMAVAGGVTCPLPFVVVDRWWETSGGRLATQTDTWDPPSDVYNEGPLLSLPGSPVQKTGYGIPDRGRMLRIYPGSPSGTPQTGWAYILAIADDQSGNVVRSWITGCPRPEIVYSYGMRTEVKSGMTDGPVQMGFDTLVAQDPTAFWGTGGNAPPGGCVFRPGVVDQGGNHVCVSSPRIKPLFLIGPGDTPAGGSESSDGSGGGSGRGSGGGGGGGVGGGGVGTGTSPATLRNFVGVFVICAGVLNPSQTSCSGSLQSGGGGVHVRFVNYRGVNPLPPGQNTGSLLRVLQLVE